MEPSLDKDLPRKTKPAIACGFLIAFGLASIALVDPQQHATPSMFRYGCVGYIIGSIFGHAVAASAWTALGPGRFLLRFPLSILWCVGLCSALAAIGPPQVVSGITVCIAAIWGLTQVPYWCLRCLGGLALRDGRAPKTGDSPFQYGILHLLIFTTIVGVILGVGRAAYFWLLPEGIGQDGEMGIFVALAGAAIIMSLPLVLAIFLRRFAFFAVTVLLFLTALATCGELAFFDAVVSRGNGPEFLHFVFINAFTVSWLLAFGIVLRWAGYRLTPRGRSEASRA